MRSHILRRGYDIDHLEELPANAQTIKTRSWLGLATSKWMFRRYGLCHLGGDLSRSISQMLFTVKTPLP